jgi:enoyl-CoA hydratase
MPREDWTESYADLLFERRAHGVLLVTINRPEAANAVHPPLHIDLGRVWGDIDGDPTVSVVVLTGAGSAFCSGGQIGTFSDEPRTSAEHDETMFDILKLVNAMVECRKPIISAVNGVAMASGVALALAADISVVGENVKLLDGHLRGGMVAGDHAALLWPLYTSLAKAKYYLLTGDSITGREAERIGLASLSVPDDEVLDRALAIAERISTNAQYAVRWTKRALNAWVKQAAPIFELSTALQMLTSGADDMRESMRAYLEGRTREFPSVLP